MSRIFARIDTASLLGGVYAQGSIAPRITVAVAILLLCSLGGCDREGASAAKVEPAASEGGPNEEAPPAGSDNSSPQNTSSASDAAPALPTPEVVKAHDVHTHLSPAAVGAALDLLSRNGIDRMVNLSGGNQDRRFEASTEIARLTNGRVIPFFNIDWDRLQTEGTGFGEAIASDFREAVAAGYGGLKISKTLGLGISDADGNLMPVDDPLLAPIFDAAGALGVPVSIHTGDPKAFFEPLDEHNERYTELSEHPSWSFHGEAFPSRRELLDQRNRLIARHPNTTFICVHFGNNPEDIDDVERLLDTYPNAMVDVSARLGELGRHPPDKLRALIVKHRTRILFGTDFMLTGSPKRGFSLTLGSFSIEPQDGDDIDAFYDAHWQFFEEVGARMPNPVPIQGEWDIQSVGLPADVLEDVYLRNAERLIFAPWDARFQSAPR